MAFSNVAATPFFLSLGFTLSLCITHRRIIKSCSLGLSFSKIARSTFCFLVFPVSGSSYSIVKNWPIVPEALVFGQVTGVDVNDSDEIVVFQPLDQDHIEKIVDLMGREIQLRLEDQNITFELSDVARKWLAREGFDSFFGARPLRRALQRFVEGPLSKGVLSGEFKSGDHILVSVDKECLEFTKSKIGEKQCV